MTFREKQTRQAELTKEIKALAAEIRSLEGDAGAAPEDEQKRADYESKWATLEERKSELDKLDGDLADAENKIQSERRSALDDIEKRKVKTFDVFNKRDTYKNHNGALSYDEAHFRSDLAIRTAFLGEDAGAERMKQAEEFGLPVNKRSLEFRLPDAPDSNHTVQERTTALLTTSIGTGGALIAPEFIASIEQALKAFGRIRDVARVIRTSTATEIPYPTIDDTANTGRIVGEGATVSRVTASFKQVKIRAWKYTSDTFPVSREMLRDSAINIPALIGDLIGTRIARAQETDFLTGTGAAGPRGLLTAATSGVTAASSTTLTPDEALSLRPSVDPAYWMGAAYMMHPNIAASVLGTMKDGVGQYLFRRSGMADTPDTFDGYPIVYNASMASTLTSGGKPIIFGQFNKFLVRDVNTIRVQRLIELLAESDQDGFLGFMESDSNLLDAGTHPVKYITMA
jgi:HK97 family phage major capsid protein